MNILNHIKVVGISRWFSQAKVWISEEFPVEATPPRPVVTSPRLQVVDFLRDSGFSMPILEDKEFGQGSLVPSCSISIFDSEDYMEEPLNPMRNHQLPQSHFLSGKSHIFRQMTNPFGIVIEIDEFHNVQFPTLTYLTRAGTLVTRVQSWFIGGKT